MDGGDPLTMVETLRQSAASTRRFVLPIVLAGVVVVAYFAGTVFRDVYYGIPPSVPVSAITAMCQPTADRAKCGVAIVRLNPGRFYLSTDGPAVNVTVLIADPTAIERSHVLLLR